MVLFLNLDIKSIMTTEYGFNLKSGFTKILCTLKNPLIAVMAVLVVLVVLAVLDYWMY